MWGGGTHQGLGHRIEPDLVISTSRLNRLIAWEPDDMTVVVEGGMGVDDLEARSGGSRPDRRPSRDARTSDRRGSAGRSNLRISTRAVWPDPRSHSRDDRCHRGWPDSESRWAGREERHGLRPSSPGRRFLRFPRCDRLGLSQAVAKAQRFSNGHPRGSRPRPASVYRPLAVLADLSDTKVFLAGTHAEVEAQAERLGGVREEGLVWPQPIPGETTWSLRVPPSMVDSALTRIPPAAIRIAQLLVGEIAFAADRLEGHGGPSPLGRIGRRKTGDNQGARRRCTKCSIRGGLRLPPSISSAD